MTSLQVGSVVLRRVPHAGYGVIVEGVDGAPIGEITPYLDRVFGEESNREAFFSLVDTHGVVVCRNLAIDPTPYRRVRGKRSRGRLSQGEFFHHDGCSTPVKPRVVEIRCPPQDCVRSMGTSVAPFPAVVRNLLGVMPVGVMRLPDLTAFDRAVAAGEVVDWEQIQGALNRAIRGMTPEAARELLFRADQAGPCFREPWTLSESRFIANNNPAATAQHRRVCYPWVPGRPNGGLLKRWPNEER
jgi:hypothetical protein